MSTWIVVLIAACEQVIKQTRENNGTEGEHLAGVLKVPVLKDKIYLTKYHNEGAFLNLGSKHKEFVKGLSMGLCAVCFLMYVFSFGKKGKKLLRTGLAFLLGGAFSNTYDRMVRGYVVDYFGFEVKNDKLRGLVFNISDFCIMIGAMITVIAI